MPELHDPLPREGDNGSRVALVSGRAAMRQRLQALDAESRDRVKRMENLVRGFQQTFRPPWPVHPVMQRVAQGYIYVRWRLSGKQGQQKYLDPGSDAAGMLMREIGQDVAKVYVAYVRQALRLNLEYALCRGEALRLRQYLNDLERIEAVWAGDVRLSCRDS